MRDFSLKLVSNGRDITSKEYLENSLAPLQGTDARLQDKNAIRQSITQFFVDRTCITMRRPVNDEKMLQHMDAVTDDELRPQFVEELQAFIKTTYTSVRPKRLFSEALTGPSMPRAALATTWPLSHGRHGGSQCLSSSRAITCRRSMTARCPSSARRGRMSLKWRTKR